MSCYIQSIQWTSSILNIEKHEEILLIFLIENHSFDILPLENVQQIFKEPNA